jgi:hypothetical protein
VRHYQRLLGYLRPYLWPRGVLAVICMLLFSGIESSIPFVAKYTFDQVFTEKHLDALPFAIIGVSCSRSAAGSSTSPPST